MAPKNNGGRKRSGPSTPSAQLPSSKAPRSLDDSAEEKLDPAEELKLKHIHFHPQSMSDIEIRYGNSVFHCHRVILAIKSKVWLALFSEKSITEKRITYPEQKTANGVIVNEGDFHYFLLSFYYPFESHDFFELKLPGEIPPPENFYILPLYHLYHYFQVPDMETRIIDCIKEYIKRKEPIEDYYYYLLASVVYRIPEGKKVAMNGIIRFYPKNKEGNEAFQKDIEEHGKKLSPALLHELHVERANFLVSSEKLFDRSS